MITISFKDELYDGDKPLFHYTTIEGLQLILQNRSFKFNPLTRVDDMEEQRARDCGDYGKYCYVSCFTLSREENIALWHMYSSGMRGVRLELPPDFFEFDKAEALIKKEFDEYSLLPVRSDYIHSIVGIKVGYTYEEDKLFPQICEPETNERYPFRLNCLGRYKTPQWAFQQEVRYIIYSYYKNWYPDNATLEEAKENLFNYNHLPNCLFIPIKDDAIKDIKIKIAPKANQFDKTIIRLIAKEYGIPEENICESNIKIR